MKINHYKDVRNRMIHRYNVSYRFLTHTGEKGFEHAEIHISGRFLPFETAEFLQEQNDQLAKVVILSWQKI